MINPWVIEKHCGFMYKAHTDYVKDHSGDYYTINYRGNMYGMISAEAWDHLSTCDILSLVERMLNDAHTLALEKHKQ